MAIHTHSSTAFIAGAQAAGKISTEAGRTKSGWIRLARMTSQTNPEEIKPYVIAVRNVLDGSVQLGCSCPHWVHRLRVHNEARSSEQHFCKHQLAFLGHKGGTSPLAGVWLYKAGAGFLDVYQTISKYVR